MEAVRDAEHPCPMCGKDQFVWGHLGAADAGKAGFYADGRSVVDRLGGVGQGIVRTRLCLGCRSLGLFVPDGEFPSGA